MRKIFALAFVVLLITNAYAGEFWASKNSNKYHRPECRWAQKIKPANLIKLKSPEEAVNSGFIPCKVCRPPVSSQTDSGVNKALRAGQS